MYERQFVYCYHTLRSWICNLQNSRILVIPYFFSKSIKILTYIQQRWNAWLKDWISCTPYIENIEVHDQTFINCYFDRTNDCMYKYSQFLKKVFKSINISKLPVRILPFPAMCSRWIVWLSFAHLPSPQSSSCNKPLILLLSVQQHTQEITYFQFVIATVFDLVVIPLLQLQYSQVSAIQLGQMTIRTTEKEMGIRLTFRQS